MRGILRFEILREIDAAQGDGCMIGKRVLAILGGLSAVAGLGFAQSAGAQPVVGVPHQWQMDFPPSYTPLMDKVASLHDLLLVIITLISVFVLVLLVYAMWRFHASRNPTPSTSTHNTLLEIAWTVIPILILVVIAIPSFRLLYYGDKTNDAAFTIKVTGHQWYWSYAYPDQGNFVVESRILSEADRVKLKPNQPRMLAVDEEMVIPKGANIRIVGTAADSMHGWTVPGFGVKKTVIPGRLNEGWINVRDEGYYFGQCSQICGNLHSYMPIAVRVVSQAEFDKWVEQKKKSAGLLPATDVASAAAPANR
jgi:cytochrome c oxidase subunit 2